MRLLALGLCCLAGGGCVVHRAAVEVPADPDGTEGVTFLDDREHPAGPATSAVAQGALPQSIQVSAWRWRVRPDGTTELVRGDTTVATPLPWWETFPYDLPADYLPVDFYARRDVTVTWQPVADRDEADLTAEAAAAGFFASPVKSSP